MSTAARGLRPFRYWAHRSVFGRRPETNEIEPIHKWHIVRGDTVYVRSGRDAGRTGKVLKVIRRTNRVIVEGCNIVKKHVRMAEGMKSGIMPIPASIHYSSVNLLDPTLSKPTRISIRYNAQTGEKVRVSKKSGALIPYPDPFAVTPRPVRPPEAGPKDTPKSAATAVTYTPDPELLPYLAAGQGIFAVRTGPRPKTIHESETGDAAEWDHFMKQSKKMKASKNSSTTTTTAPEVPLPLPKILAGGVKLRKVNRNRLRRKWEARQGKKALAREIDSYISTLFAAAEANAKTTTTTTTTTKITTNSMKVGRAAASAAGVEGSASASAPNAQMR